VSNASSVQPPPAWRFFQDQTDYHYFCLFRDKTSIELSAGFEPILWNQLVLQACDNQSILQLTIATAALSKAQERDLWESETCSHRQYALQQYGKALKGIQEMVSTGQDSMRIALIAALLIFCFESLLGDTAGAVIPIQSSLDLIFKRLATVTRLSRTSRTKSRVLPELGLIDEELLFAYMRLDGPSLAMLSRQESKLAPPSNRIFSLVFYDDDFQVPSGFATISEARLYLEDIKWRALPNVQTHSHHQYQNQASKSPSPYPENHIPKPKCKHWWSAPINASLHSQFAQWHQAFEPLLEYSMTPAGEKTLVAAATLHIQALSHSMVISGFNFRTSRSSSKTMLQTASTILALSRRLVDYPSFTKGFVFDIGIIPALVIILMLCPERELKVQATTILGDMVPRREGVWDSRIVWEAGLRILRWEEEGENAKGFDSFSVCGGEPGIFGSGFGGGEVADELIDPRLREMSRNEDMGNRIRGFEPTLREFLGA
jgi:hypothetical protein